MKNCRGCEAHGGIQKLVAEGEISTVWTNRGVQVGQSCSSRREVSPVVPFELMKLVGVSAGQSVDASAIGESLDDDGLACRWCAKFSLNNDIQLCV